MKYSLLGSSDLSVSSACLGSMTWGLQNNQQQANSQIEYAISKDINFIDTAEIYAVPPSSETFGKTEEIIGRWLGNNGSKRSDLIIASKIAGKGLPWVRDAGPITGRAVELAVEGSLQRLQTDYLDLYQLHWPNRAFPHFGRHALDSIDFNEVQTEQELAGMHDILEGLARCVSAGKIRYCGLSDDTPWGISSYLKLSEAYNLPRIVSIQNEFSLLHTKDSPYLLETCIRENIAYLPWSPLATGILTGKYANNTTPRGSRWSIEQRSSLHRDTETAHEATKGYMDIAAQNDLSPAQLALAWCQQVKGVTSTIIGATNLEQLTDNISAFEIELSDAVLTDIKALLKMYPIPF